jgi:hypothetical protein
VEGMITRVSVTWTEIADDGQQDRADLTLVCEQLQAARDPKANGTVSADFGRALRRIK